MSNGGGRVSIPAKVKKVIQNIKEIAGNHDDEEVYFMLKECNMDPNETAQKLLSQDSFHEVVRRKRDRRKENVRESTGSRWKPGMQDQGSRGERGNHSSRYLTHDAGGVGQNFVSIKENGTSHVSADKVAISTLSNSQDVKNKEATHASSNVNVDTHAGGTSESKSVGHAVQPVAAASDVTKVDDPLQSKSTADENNTNTKFSSDVGSSSFMHETIPNISLVVHKDQHSESSKAVVSTHSHPTGSIPLSEYGVRSPEVIGPQKVVGPNKECKPKPTNPSLPEGPETTLMLEVPAIPVEPRSQDAKQTTFGLEKKLEETCISDSPQVIIPKHIHVPEIEKLGFIFGSFDANFGLSTSYPVCPENENSPTIPETSEGVEENADQTSNHDELMSVEEEDYSPASPNASGSLISDVSSRVVSEYSESKQETDLPPGYQQYSTVHAYPNYGFGIMPPMVGSQVLPTESTKSQTHDVSRLPGFVVQQPYDLSSYYAQFYRSGGDNEGRLSPFYEPAIPTKVNGNVTMLPPETSQSSQEGGNTLILPTTASTPPVTQATGVVPSSVAVTQQALPVFGQPAGMHLPHYPNYIPYHYFPFYVPPPAMHHFLSTGVLPPPQLQAGSVYPAPVPTNKYSVPQYKPGTTTANTNNVAAPGSYGPYGSTPASLSASSATTTGHSSSSEDLLTAQLKENDLFIAGQQSEGPGVWFAAPGRDISGLQASSFYNLPQAQMAFPATQVSHGNFAGIYQPAQPVTGASVHPLLQQSQAMAGPIDMNGPAPSVYQPSQPPPINWPKNC